MKYINEENALVIKSWCDNPEEGAIEQARNLARLPFAFRQICLMPDTHQGYGMPIGGVMATQGAVVVNAVGSDVGCGMSVFKTSLTEISVEDLKKICDRIYKTVPVGMKHHEQAQPVKFMPANYSSPVSVLGREYERARKQLGTLGGGNHFIEIQKGGDGHIWAMVHSGSRNLGKQTADFYNKKAVELNERYFSRIPKEWQLAFLPPDSEEGESYMVEMAYCVRFALANRSLMMERIKEAFMETVKNVSFEPAVNIAHNYAMMEHHFGRNVLVHRKGATSAKEGEFGIIPGSQGASSYIVRGKGNPESFMSCSHGAGRKMGRNQASRLLNFEEEKRKLEDRGILHNIQSVSDLDEAPGAYKDIDIVMKEQSDLVDVVVKLEPMAVVKDGGKPCQGQTLTPENLKSRRIRR